MRFWGRMRGRFLRGVTRRSVLRGALFFCLALRLRRRPHHSRPRKSKKQKGARWLALPLLRTQPSLLSCALEDDEHHAAVARVILFGATGELWRAVTECLGHQTLRSDTVLHEEVNHALCAAT